MEDKPKILFTSAYGPFDNYGFNEPIFDVFTNRLTKGQDIFTLSGHFHIPPLHTVAQNIDHASVVLETPTLEGFEKELKEGDYDYVGITCNVVHMEKIFKMGRRVRELSPKTKVVLGGYGIQCLNEVFSSDAELKEVADYTCHGEGVRFMRKILGEEPLTNFREDLPSCNISPRWLPTLSLAPLTMSFLTSGLGCPNLCEFCSTSHFYDGEYVELSGAKQLFEGMKLHANNGKISMIWDEDFPQKKDKFETLAKLIQEDDEYGLRRLFYFTFGSIKALSEYSPEELLMSGLGIVWIGIESLFSGLEKRQGSDVRTVFNDLHDAGIYTVGSWIGGWDFHDRVNIQEDREFFLSLRPVFSQLSQLLPVPETALWERLKEEGRLHDDVPWKDFHFYGGAYKYKNFERHEILYFLQDMHTRLYDYAGPSLMRMLEYAMNGYEFCKKSRQKVLNEQKSEFFQMLSWVLYSMIPPCRAYAPNGFVRARINDLDQRYRRVFGAPNQTQIGIGEYSLKQATEYKKRYDKDPEGVKGETDYTIPKRYLYGADKFERMAKGMKPYIKSFPEGTPQEFENRSRV